MNTNASSMCPECYTFLEPNGYCNKCEKVTAIRAPKDPDPVTSTTAPIRPKRIEYTTPKEQHFFQTTGGAGCLSTIAFFLVFFLVFAGSPKPSESSSPWVSFFNLLGSFYSLLIAGGIALLVSLVLFFVLLFVSKSQES